ncbi:MAG: DUF6273 domain-containing protein [Collinsella phocaeensis]
MADVKTLNVKGTNYTMIDQTARDNATRAINNEEYDRQDSIGAFSGRSLTSEFAEEISGKGNVWTWLQGRVKAGNFAGLRIGDYVDVQVAQGANVNSQTIRYQIGAIDPYYQCGDSAKGHHIAMVPRTTVSVRGDKAVNTSYLPWRSTNDNNGTADVKNPYLCSLLHEWEIEDFLPALPAELQAVLMTQRVLLEERYSASGKLTEPSSWSWQDLGKIWSLSEVEVYGQNVWSKPGYGTGFDCQFPIFKQTKDRIMGSRVYWWLRSVSGSSSSDVCFVTSYGHAYCYSPTYGWVRPRPCFLVG